MKLPRAVLAGVFLLQVAITFSWLLCVLEDSNASVRAAVACRLAKRGVSA
jgi:hypothetical protein